MKRLFALISILLAALTASAQIRTYSDIEAKTFVIGLDSYFFGEAGALDFTTGGKAFQARIDGPEVHIGDALLETGSGETLVGIHDFTGDNQPELVVARRDGNALSIRVYQAAGGQWKQIGRIGASGDGISEARVFRQAFTIRNRTADALYTWTWHTGRFDFKSSDGSPDPTL